MGIGARSASPRSAHYTQSTGREKRKSFNTPRPVYASSGAIPLTQAQGSNLPHTSSFGLVGPEGDNGFSTQYGASASSPGGRSESEVELERNHFVSALGDQTEGEGWPLDLGRDRDRDSPRVQGGQGDYTGHQIKRKSRTEAKVSPPLTSHTRGSFSTRRPPPNMLPRPPQATLLPFLIGFASSSKILDGGRPWSVGFNLTRRRCEDGLLLGAVSWGVWKLVNDWHEIAIAGEISLLLGLCIVYISFRHRPPRLRAHISTMPPPRPQSPSSLSFLPNQIRDRSSRVVNSLAHSATSGNLDNRRFSPPTIPTEEISGIGSKGCVWGTEEREYRECLDDGALFALLLAPLVACALLHAALTQLASNPSSPLPPGWDIEPPLILPTTPIRQITSVPMIPNDTVRALSALATSRRNLVQLFTLLSFVLLVHLASSLRLVVKQSKLAAFTPLSHTSAGMEREGSDSSRHGTNAPLGSTYWLRKGEWRRNKNVVGFAFLVTAGCVGVKIVTAIIGRGVWSDMSPSDIIIATLFYQFSLYVCVRLARRGFTLGELGVVCSAATAMFMETVNLTRMKIVLLQTPYIKTYRLPTPLLTFQLALIPGSLLAGLLLSPLLYLSRHLAQKPAHRLRFPQEKPIHRRLLAMGFYTGSALVCGGLVGFWTRWCLGWRDPWLWIAWWIVDGKRWWTRPALLTYWGVLAVISVAGWSRQLLRARRHRSYAPPAPLTRAEKDAANTPPATAAASTAADGSGFKQMMDAADQRLPTFSVNSRRKFFHALAVVMFVPGIAYDPAFTHLSFSVAFAVFNFAEYIRYFALWPFGVSVHLFLNEFLDSKDSGTAILSHFYLLAGCASPLWLEGPTPILAYIGVLSLGIGDALASIVGKRLGRTRWSASNAKTLEGSLTFLASVLFATLVIWALGLVRAFNILPYTVMCTLATLLEAFSAQNDNLILPMYGWAMGILLGV